MVSATGAGFAWWFAKGLRKARDAAKQSEERAARSLAAAEEQAAAVARLARRFARPDLAVEWKSNEYFALRNTTEEDIRVEEVLTDLEFVELRLDVPATIKAGMTTYGELIDFVGCRHIEEIEVRVSGRDRPVIIPLTGRPSPRRPAPPGTPDDV